MKYAITLSSFAHLDEGLFGTLAMLQEQGYDAVEVLGDPINPGLDTIKATLDTFDLDVSGVSGMWGVTLHDRSRFHTNLISNDPTLEKSCIEYAKYCLGLCNLFDGKNVNICLTSDEQPLSMYELTHGVECYFEKQRIMDAKIIPLLILLTRIAKDNGVRLLLEPLNRYCSQLCNTADEAGIIAEKINDDSFGILLDTYHMNIEEASYEIAIQNSKKWLRHTHFADSNRKMPGYGHIEFTSIVNALKKIGHEEYICFEPNLSCNDFKEATKQGLDYIKRIENSS
ncbi:MAG TPA: sugar phosphate isomerase/epimerase family protein [Nitrososphaeraceae archaeon]